MGLDYLLRRVASKLGMKTTNSEQRKLMVDIINIACEEVWESTDLPGSVQEVIINVLANNEMSLPPYIGELRAMREKSLMHKWTLNDMRPRYQSEPWKQLWRNWRHKGYRATQIDITNSAPGFIVNPVADNTIVTLRGSTSESNNIAESITMDALVKTWTKSFTEIRSITKDVRNDYDIQIQDINSNVLAVLYNDCLNTEYIVVDVSQYPFGGEGANGERIMEVLFKRKLYRLENNADEFPVLDWDNIIVDKVMQLYNEDQKGKEQRALLYAQKVQLKSHNKVKHKEGGQEKEVQYTENPFYGMTKRPYSRIWRG